ncbi:MAG TPA: hypothetical protein VGK97_01290 [Spongiibacteraceae bacterium]
MDAPLYDVYLTGQLADGVTPTLAAQRLAALFKSTPEAMAGLITGKTQLLKRGVDKNTALKYRDALQAAGCEMTFKAQTIAPASEAAKPAAAMSPAQSSNLQLAPAGEDLLRPNERHATQAVNVDTNHLSVALAGPLPPMAVESARVPDTDHLSLVAPGGNLLNDAERQIPPLAAPDISGLSLAPVGAEIETLKNDIPPLQVDISQLQLAPAGADLLTPEQRKHPQPAPPATDHLKLVT